MYNALAYNYYLGEEDESHYYWDKLKQISKVEIGHAPWVIENSKEVFLTNIFCHYFKVMTVIILYMGLFLLDQLNGKEIVMTESIWQVLENLNNYEKLYLTYLVQGLTLNKLDFIHRGLLTLYQNELFVSENDFNRYID